MQAYIIIFIVLFVLATNSYSQDTIRLSKSTESKFNITKYLTTVDTLEVNINLAQIELSSNNNGNYFKESSNYIKLTSKGLGGASGKGKPEIPVFSTLIECPLEASVSFKISNVKNLMSHKKSR